MENSSKTAFLLVLSVAVTTSLPIKNGTVDCPAADDYSILRTLPRANIGTDLPGFHYIFVNDGGETSSIRQTAGIQIEIAGSPRTSEFALQAAADVVSKMSKYMPSSIFSKLASSAGVGVFTASEKLTVFPELSGLASGNCGTNCAGCCASTCAIDGSKYEDLSGVGGQRGVVLDSNVLCTADDPFRHEHNILSYEFTHTVHNHALPSSVKQQIIAAFNAAKLHSTWTMSSIAMANDQEYFAQGTSTFLGVNKDQYYSGGMNLCGVNNICSTEHEARIHLQTADPVMYGILSYVFTNNRPYLMSGSTICPSNTTRDNYLE